MEENSVLLNRLTLIESGYNKKLKSLKKKNKALNERVDALENLIMELQEAKAKENPTT